MAIIIEQRFSGFFVLIQTLDDVALSITKSGTGSGNALTLKNLGTDSGCFINQDGNGRALNIDSEATSKPLIFLAPINGNSRGDIAFNTTRVSDASSPNTGDVWWNQGDLHLMVKAGPTAAVVAASAWGGRFGAQQTNVISGGIATTTGGNMSAQAEGSPAADDLDTINVGSAREGEVIVVRASSGDTLTVKNGTGNLKLNGSDAVLNTINDNVVLMWNGSNWIELSRAVSVAA